MKKIYSILLIFTLFVIAFSNSRFIKTEAFSQSQAEMVIEKSSGRILSKLNENLKLPIASTTKIVTALTVIENFNLDTVITVTDKTVGIEGSSIYLKEGDKFTVKDLLYGLMLRSGNDSAETLAVGLCGDVRAFVKLMNDTAKKYGATNSNFTNPHGLHDENHYSTAHDMARITCEGMKNPVFKQIVSTKSYTATEIVNNTKIVWINKNKLLNRLTGATGVKTGYTTKSGRCLVSSAEKDGMEVICVVLNSPQMYERSEELLNSAFKDYRLVKVVDRERFTYSRPDYNFNYIPLKIERSFYYPLKNDEKISVKLDLPDFLPKNVKISEKVGEIKIYNSKQLIFLENIYTL